MIRQSSTRPAHWALLGALALASIVAVACRAAGTDRSQLAARAAPPTVAKGPQSPASASRDASASTDSGPSPADQDSDKVVIQPGGARAVRADYGAVTSVEANATRAGVRMLERGGNAVDAAIAVAFALAVTHPSAGNIGGGGFMLVRPAGGPTTAIDFRETAPTALNQGKFDAMIAAGGSGPVAVGVPGSVAGLNLAQARFGKLPLAEVLAPAIELAEKGHRLGARQAQTIAWAWAQLRRDPAARAVFGERSGQPKATGSWIRQPALAETLKRIAKDGDAGFYIGPTAEGLIADLGKEGLLTLQDLKAYRPRVRRPISLKYRGLQVELMPPPSAGGAGVATMLTLLQHLAAYQQPAGSPEALHLFIETSRRAQAERRFNVGDPDRWTNEQLAERVKRWTNPDESLAGAPIRPEKATPSSEAHALYEAGLRELEHTTHFSVADAQGNVVSCTTTLSAGFGAKMISTSTGVVLNNSVAAFGTAGENLPAPGRRSASSMVPTLVLRSGRPILVLGSPGGDTIPSTVTQVLRNVVDYGMTIDAAVDAPRIHHGFVPDEVRVENRPAPPRAVLRALETMGHRISNKRRPMGDANCILIDGNTAWAYADPREGGLALAASRSVK
jgi:gamma-glutamyltranspeptidase/glutathione hydrolase